MRATVRVSWGWIGIAILAAGYGGAGLMRAQAAHEPGEGPAGAAKTRGGAVSAVDNPLADPKAVVTVGNARFTVLTPQLIRMEWSATGKFEDHASFVFINRKLPVPKFSSRIEFAGNYHIFEIHTDALTLSYDVAGTPDSGGMFNAKNLRVSFKVDGKDVVWHPGDSDSDNLRAPRGRWIRRGDRRLRSR